MKVSSICQAIDEQAAERKRRLGMPRDVLPQLPSVRNFATVVTGVRRSGKSTLLDQWTSENGGNVVSVHFDDLRSAGHHGMGKVCRWLSGQEAARDGDGIQREAA